MPITAVLLSSQMIYSIFATSLVSSSSSYQFFSKISLFSRFQFWLRSIFLAYILIIIWFLGFQSAKKRKKKLSREQKNKYPKIFVSQKSIQTNIQIYLYKNVPSAPGAEQQEDRSVLLKGRKSCHRHRHPSHLHCCCHTHHHHCHQRVKGRFEFSPPEIHHHQPSCQHGLRSPKVLSIGLMIFNLQILKLFLFLVQSFYF